jgi:putative transcriptional regulator
MAEKFSVSKGDLLISEPYLPDPNFERTVILICEHNEEGSIGFVLNKPSILKLEDVMDEVQGFETTLYTGGPVQQNTLHFIHKTKDIFSDYRTLKEGLYWGGNFDELLSFINIRKINPGDFRFFIGYSGWSPDQLETEIKENSWIIYKNATPEQVFGLSPDSLWRSVLKSMGGEYRAISNYPIDPRLN